MLKLYNNDNIIYYTNRSVQNDNLKKSKPIKDTNLNKSKPIKDTNLNKSKPIKDTNLNKSEKSAPKKNIKSESNKNIESELNKLPPIPKEKRVQRNNLKNSAFKVNDRRRLDPIEHVPVDETRFKWNNARNGSNINDVGDVGSKTKVRLKHLEPLKVDPKRDIKKKKSSRRNARILTKITRETAIVYNDKQNKPGRKVTDNKQRNKPSRKVTDDKPKPVNRTKIFIRQETYQVLEPKYVKGPEYNLSKQNTSDAIVDETLAKLKIFRLNDDERTYTKDIFGSPVFVSKVYDGAGNWNDLFGKKNVTPPPTYERAMERYDILNRSKLYLNEALRNLDDSHVRLNNIFKNIESTKRRSKTRINRVKSNRLD